MDKIEIKTCVGIGDLVLNYSQLEAIKQNYSEIRICPSYDLLDTYRGGSKEVHTFTKNLASLLFSSPPYKLIDVSNARLTAPEELGWQTSPIDLSDRLCLKENINIGADNYIVIQTKIRYFEKSEWGKYSKILYSTLRNIKNCKIVIMGERSTGCCVESKIHSNSIFVIPHEELKRELNWENCIDLTKDVLLENPNIDNLKRDLTIIRNSRCVITFGVSGIVSAIAATSKNMAGFRTDGYTIVNGFYNGLNQENKLITHDFDKFIKFIENKTN